MTYWFYYLVSSSTVVNLIINNFSSVANGYIYFVPDLQSKPEWSRVIFSFQVSTISELQSKLASEVHKVEVDILPQKVDKEDLHLPDNLMEQIEMLKQGSYINVII